jgi:hypothetical protein
VDEGDAAHRRVRRTPTGYGGGHGRGGPADLDVLDLLVGDLAHPPDQVVLEPA